MPNYTAMIILSDAWSPSKGQDMISTLTSGLHICFLIQMICTISVCKLWMVNVTLLVQIHVTLIMLH